MKVTIKYFGMIAEAVGKPEEDMTLNPMMDVVNLEKILQKSYPRLEKLSYKVAVNKKLSDGNYSLQERDEIAFLPPFAGG